jgi:hypothetical protein
MIGIAGGSAATARNEFVESKCAVLPLCHNVDQNDTGK